MEIASITTGLRDEAPSNDDGREAGARFRWLDRVEHDRWCIAWEALWRHFERTRDDRALGELAARATRWLTLHGSAARWAAAWSFTVAHAASRGARDDLRALLRAGLRWFQTHPGDPSRPSVWCDLVVHRAELPEVADLAALVAVGAASLTKQHPAPTAPRGARGETPMVCAATGALTRVVRAYATREALPGRVVEARGDGYVVDVGVRAFVPTSHVWMGPGDAVMVDVMALTPRAGVARFGGARAVWREPDETVVVGREEEGRVASVSADGACVLFRGFRGFVPCCELTGEARSCVKGTPVRAVVRRLEQGRAVLSLASVSARAA